MLKFIYNSDKKCRLHIKNIDLSIINALRRIILTEIPNVGVYFDPYEIDKNTIKVITNTGVLHNEFIAHRISLIPICLSDDEIDNFDESDYYFKLHMKCNNTNIILVKSSDIQVFDSNKKKLNTEHFFPENPITKDHILITKLKPNIYDISKGDELDIEFTLVKSTAQTHARWSPVSKCVLHNVPVPGGNGERDFITNSYDEPCEFYFDIESECRLTPLYLLNKGLNILIEKIREFSMDDTFSTMTYTNETYIINVKNESHTLLNVLQSMIYNYYFRNNKQSQNPLDYIGYFQPHPLDKTMVLKIRLNQDTADFTKCTNIIKDACENIIEYIESLVKDLAKISK